MTVPFLPGVNPLAVLMADEGAVQPGVSPALGGVPQAVAPEATTVPISPGAAPGVAPVDSLSTQSGVALGGGAPAVPPGPVPQHGQFPVAGQTTQARTVSTGTPRTRRDRQLESERQSLVQQQIELERRRAPIEQEQAQIQAQAQLEQAELSRQRETAIAGVRAEAEAEFGRRQAQDSADIDRMRSLRDETFWGDDTGRRIQGTIAIALGQFAAHMSGRRNVALDMINQQIERWRADRQSRIDDIAASIERRTKSAEAAQQFRVQSLDLLDKEHIAARERVAAQAAASMAQAGIPAAAIAQDARIIGLQQEALAQRQAREDLHRGQVQQVVEQSVDRINTAVPRTPQTQIVLGGELAGGAQSEGASDPGGIFDPVSGERIASLGPKRAKAASAANDLLAAGSGLEDQLRQLLDIVDQVKPEGQLAGLIQAGAAKVIETPEGAEMRSIANGLISTLNQIRKLGALSEKEMGLLESQLGVDSLTRGAARASLLATLRNARRDMVRQLAAKGLRGRELAAVANRVMPDELLGAGSGGSRAGRGSGPNRTAESKPKSNTARAVVSGKIQRLRAALDATTDPGDRAKIEAAIGKFEAQLQ